MFNSQNSVDQNPQQSKRITQAQWWQARDAMFNRCLKYAVALENTGRFYELDAALERAMYNEYQRARPLVEQLFNLHSLCIEWSITLPEDCNGLPF